MKFRLLYQGHERRLSPGNLLVGRSPDCGIVLDDPLVSRHHAVFRIAEASVHIEDLGSRNGVLVNGELIDGVTGLQDGDSIGIVDHQLQLAAGCGASGLHTTARAGASIKPAEMFGVLGALADKALAMGQGAEAQRLLGTHLDSLLSDMGEGRHPEDEALALALRYAARLAVATRRGYWFSYVFKVLCVTNQSCPAEVLDELYSGASRAESTPLQEIRDYISFHAARTDGMSPRERFLLSRVQGLERLLSA